eukprot:Lankesteria_metandrocarpae@DN4038_c0_g1_i1.p2
MDVQSRCGVPSLFFVLATLIACRSRGCAADVPLTYSSAVQISHGPSNYRLVSGKVAWGGGSNQLAVTAEASTDSNTSLWLVLAGSEEKTRAAGSIVACGDVLRFEHGESAAYLNSSPKDAMVSSNYEVGCDERDAVNDRKWKDFKVECIKGDTVLLGESIRLKHVQSSGYLHTDKAQVYNQRNCPGCPIIGHREVSVTKKSSAGADDIWKLLEVINVQSTEDEYRGDHEEL